MLGVDFTPAFPGSSVFETIFFPNTFLSCQVLCTKRSWIFVHFTDKVYHHEQSTSTISTHEILSQLHRVRVFCQGGARTMFLGLHRTLP